MIINNPDIVRIVLDPPETYAPLAVDPDAQLPGALALERFEPVSRRVPKVLDRSGRIQLSQLP